MKQDKRSRLEQAGWKLGSAEDFLGLSDAEREYVQLRLALARGVRQLREHEALTQQQLAERIGSSQSRIAKLEAADPSVSADLAIKALLALGADRKRVAKILAAPVRGRAA